MMLNSAAAGPVGRRRSCSQFCSVFTLTPINRANSDCDRLVRSRITRTPEERTAIRREGVRWPRRIAPPSRTLSRSSSNTRLFTAELLLDDFGEPRNLYRSQIRHCVLRIRVEQQDHVFPYRPIVNDACAAALSPRSNRDADLAYPPTTSYARAEFRIRSEPGLKSTVFLIAQQSGDLPREGRSLNQLHSTPLSANGG